METRQLESTTGFVIYDLPDAEHYVGQARLGAKLAPGNATMLVRHQTYVFATLEQRKSGATIGFKVDPEGGADAIAAAAGELEDELTSNRLLTSPGLRLDRDQLDPFLRHDQRNAIGQSDRDGITFEEELVGVGASASAAALVGDLDGKRVAIEGFGRTGLAIAREVERKGGAIARVATSKGCVSGNFDAATLADAWMSSGPACIEQLGDAGKPWEIWKGDVDAIFVGSKPGAMSGEGASSAGTTAVVAYSAAAISSKALALLRQQGAPASADFVSAVGPALSWWADADTDHDAIRDLTESTVSGVLADAAGHADGAFLGACHRAEAFMASWQDELPFGRPLG